MNIHFDKIADALYFTLQDGMKVAKTIEMDTRMLVDVDENGNVLGFEVLDVSHQLNGKTLEEFSNNLLEGIPVKITNETSLSA